MAEPNRILPQLTPQQIARFEAKIPRAGPDECWEWRARCDEDGYGVWQPQQKAQPFRAHRIAYYLSTGVDPRDLWVLHRCDNPPCCNPAHLFTGTNIANVVDRVQKGRNATGESVRPKRSLNGGYRGEGHPAVKLTNAQVLEIRAKYIPRKYPSRRLAREYGVEKSIILLIVNRRQWTHI